MSIRVKYEPKESSTIHHDETSALPMNLDDDGAYEEDEIIREMDVFLSPDLSNHLHLMQFPLQRQLHPNNPVPQAARIKARHCMIELDYPTRAPDSNDQDYSGQFHMSTRTYSSQTIPISTHMALGKLVVDEAGEGTIPAGLHLIPLTRIAQMRPNFHHVNEATMNMMATEDEHETQSQTLDGRGSSRKPLAFQKKESERAALARKSSFGYKKASEEAEFWIPLEIHSQGTVEYEQALDKVSCSKPEENLLLGIDESSAQQPETVASSAVMVNNVPSLSSLSPYVQSLNYLPQRFNDTSRETEKLDENENGETEDIVASVVGRMVRLMEQGWPIPYSVLRVQFDESVPSDTLFTALGSCAFLVRGNFILQSRLLPMPSAVSQARTFILFLFETLEVVHRPRLEQVYQDDDQVTPDVILMLLEQVAKRTTHAWKLKVDDDETFPLKYPSAIQIHLEFWGNQVRRLGPLFERYRQQPQDNGHK